MDVINFGVKELLQPRIVLAEHFHHAIVAPIPTNWQSLNVLQLAVLVPLGLFLSNVCWTQVRSLLTLSAFRTANNGLPCS